MQHIRHTSCGAKKGFKRNRNSHNYIIKKIKSFSKLKCDNFQNIFGRLLLGLTIVRGVFRTQWNIYDEAYWRKQLGKIVKIFHLRRPRLGSKNTSDIQSWERKTQQKSISCQNKLLANSFLQKTLLALQHLKVFAKSFYFRPFQFLKSLNRCAPVSSNLQYQPPSLQLFHFRDEVCPLLKKRRSTRMVILGQTPAKTLIIQFHLYLLTNKQWLRDFKILHILSTFTNITMPFIKSIL